MSFTVDSIGTFVALGGTYASHQDETGTSYRWPDIWILPDSAVVGNESPIRIPERVEDVKPGAELSAVIGEPIHDASEIEAWEAIKGFTVSNDVTAAGEWPGYSDPERNIITGVGYKTLPTFSPILTNFVPREDERTYEDLEVTVEVDGEVSVHGSTSQMAFSIPKLVSFASQIVSLEENDVIAMGDPGTPEKFLDKADAVTCRIEGIGELTNTVQRV